jgi:hypothetical protein
MKKKEGKPHFAYGPSIKISTAKWWQKKHEIIQSELGNMKR